MRLRIALASALEIVLATLPRVIRSQLACRPERAPGSYPRTLSTLVVAGALLGGAGCHGDDDPLGGSESEVNWLVSQNLGQLAPCFVGLLTASVPMRLDLAPAEAVLTAKDTNGMCRSLALVRNDDMLSWSGPLTALCANPIEPSCEISGDVKINIVLAGDRFSGNFEGTMEAVPGSGCQFDWFTFTREVFGTRCSGCMLACP